MGQDLEKMVDISGTQFIHVVNRLVPEQISKKYF